MNRVERKSRFCLVIMHVRDGKQNCRDNQHTQKIIYYFHILNRE